MLGRVGAIVVVVTLAVTGCAQSAPDGYTCVPRRPGEWCTLDARSRYQLVLAYPPGWKLAPVFMVMGQGMFELHHGTTGAGGRPAARLFVDAHASSQMDHRARDMERLEAPWTLSGEAPESGVRKRRPVEVGGRAAVEVLRLGTEEWSRAVLIPFDNMIVVVRLVGDVKQRQSATTRHLEEAFDEVVRRLVLAPLDPPWGDSSRHAAAVAEIEERLGKGSVQCAKPVPGHLVLGFRDTVSVATVRAYVRDTLIRAHGFSEKDLQNFGFSYCSFEDLLREDGHALTVSFGLSATGAEGSLADPKLPIFKDRRLRWIHGTTGRVFAVEFREGRTPRGFARDYPGLIPFPPEVLLVDRERRFENLPRPPVGLFAQRGLQDHLALLERLRRAVPADEEGRPWLPAKYDDHSEELEVSFPSRYSPQEILRIAEFVRGKARISERPTRIVLPLRVGVGNEQRWMVELKKRTDLLDRIEQSETACLSFGTTAAASQHLPQSLPRREP
jgi:hypothetical protein